MSNHCGRCNRAHTIQATTVTSAATITMTIDWTKPRNGTIPPGYRGVRNTFGIKENTTLETCIAQLQRKMTTPTPTTPTTTTTTKTTTTNNTQTTTTISYSRRHVLFPVMETYSMKGLYPFRGIFRAPTFCCRHPATRPFRSGHFINMASRQRRILRGRLLLLSAYVHMRNLQNVLINTHIYMRCNGNFVQCVGALYNVRGLCIMCGSFIMTSVMWFLFNVWELCIRCGDFV